MFIAGGFDSIGNASIKNIAVWDGNVWSNIGNFPGGDTVSSIIHKLIIDPNGDIYCSVQFDSVFPFENKIVKYDGINWEFLPAIYGNLSFVTDLEFYKNNLYVSGYFNVGDGNIGNNILYLENNQWKNLDSGTNGKVRDMLNYNDKLWV
ncbi:MAG: hypothetical protein LH629_05865, partial [Ignavibacteria bacterium]|nr:hypothetical protein [Ignavibacteria bacterium]